MTITTEHQEALQVIKNIAHTRSVIYTEYREILKDETKAKKLMDEIFTLNVDFSELRAASNIILKVGFTIDSFDNFLKLCIYGYRSIISEVNELQQYIRDDIAADKLELKLMLLASIMQDFAERNEVDIQIFKDSYYSEQLKPLFNRFFDNPPSDQTFKNFFSESVKFLDIGANYFTQMYDLMTEVKIITPEFLKMQTMPSGAPTDMVNRSSEKLDDKLQSYAAMLNRYAAKIFQGENSSFVTEQDISEIANLFSTCEQIDEEDDLLSKEYNVLSKLTASYPPSSQDGILTPHPALTSSHVFNINYKSLMLHRKFKDLYNKIDKEMQHSKSIFDAIIYRLQNARKASEAVATSLGNEESDPQIPEVNIDQHFRQQIADNNLKAKQNKEAEKPKAAAKHQQGLVWAQQKMAALNVNGSEEAPPKLHVLSREDYATLQQLFSKSKIDFKIESLMSLAKHCDAECTETKSGFKVKFSNSLAYISEPTAVKVSPALTYHRQHRTDRNIDAGIVAAFKAALEEAGFTPATCTVKPSNSPRMTGG